MTASSWARRSSWLSVRYDQIATISLEGIQLSNEKLYPYHSDEYMLRIKRDLLDQQIIDVNGRKVVRVNDVTFEVRRDERESLAVLEVDVGVRSIFRRLMQGAVPPRLVRDCKARFRRTRFAGNSAISSKPTRCAGCA